MADIVLPDMFVFYLALLAVSVSLAYALGYYFFKKRSLSSLLSLPSVVITGTKSSGKNEFVRVFADHYLTVHPIKDHLKVSRLVHGKKVMQFVIMPDVIKGGVLAKEIEEVRSMNTAALIHLIDASSSTQAMERQISNIEKFMSIFDGKKHVVVAGNLENMNEAAFKALKKRFRGVVNLSVTDEKSMKRMRGIINGLFSTA